MFPKPEPRAKFKARQQRAEAKRAKAFQMAVWQRCGPWCKYCGCPVRHPADDDWLRVGHVHHLRGRNVAPEDKFNPRQGGVVVRDLPPSDSRREDRAVPNRDGIGWFIAGFCAGAGWALAAWLVGRILIHV